MEEFSKPWMKKCNQDLILRYWRSRGSPGKLTISRYGLNIEYSNTALGELMTITNYIRASNWLERNIETIFKVN